MVDKLLSEMGDSELQEYLLASGFIENTFKNYQEAFPEKVCSDLPLESYSFTIIDFSKNTKEDI